MSEDGQREPGSGRTAHRGRPGAGQARQDAGGENPPGDGQDHAGAPRPDALIPALDEGQLAALREIGREWDRVSADPQVWRQALPIDPSLGEYPEASQVRPALFTRFVPVAGQDGQLPPIETTSVSETPLTPPGRAGQALKRLVFGPPLDAMFAVPTYAFIAAIAALVVAGLVHAAGRGFHPVPVRHLAIAQAVTVLPVLRAFAVGCTAMTGIEAISNAVPAFNPTEWRNARITLSWMTGLLIGMFGGVLMITRLAGIVPVASQTMLSQLAHLSFGDSPMYASRPASQDRGP